MTPKSPPTEAELALVRSCVLYEDDQLIALNKPAGLSSQGARGGVNSLEDLLVVFARSNGKRPHLVHRLDRDTSGVILAARTKPAAAFLGKRIAARQIRKSYLAIVTPGAPDPASGTIEVPLRRVERGREVFMQVCPPDHPDAETALSRYRTLSSSPQAALLSVSPHTGRMHQIRVHLAHLGRPIAGDPRYGGALVLGGEAVPRLMLHAQSLSFAHPSGGERRIIAEPPADFIRVASAAQLAITPG